MDRFANPFPAATRGKFSYHFHLLHLSVSHANFYVGEDMVSEAQDQDMGAGWVRKVGEERVARGSNRVERVGK